MYDLIIIGGGPAGAAAGVYAARKRLQTVLIAESMGGQSTESQEIQNWIGTPRISGEALGKALEAHVRAYADGALTLQLGERVESVRADDDAFTVVTARGEYRGRAVIVATGGSHRKLNVPGAKEFEHKGVTYCASCDGPLFTGQDVVVVGGGNSGFEAASQLLAYCKSVTLIHRSPEFSKADAADVAAVSALPNFAALRNTEPVEVKGTAFVEAITIKDRVTGEVRDLPTAAIFVEIGMTPATSFVQGLVTLDDIGYVKVDPRTQRTSLEGIWAAGDCTDGLYHQNNIAAGDAVKALEDIYYWLKKRSVGSGK